jgi:hypothetical protein
MHYNARWVQGDEIMPFKIEYHAEHDYVESTFTGPIGMPLVRDYIAALLPVLEKTGCSRLLNDSTRAQIQFSSFDVLQFPKLAAVSPLTAGLKRAALAATGSSGYQMYATLSKIQGQNLNVFTDREDALKWLLAEEQ